MILTGHRGTNDELIAEVAKLYLKKGAVVADFTYGKGVFWKLACPPGSDQDKNGDLKLYCFDIEPQFDYVIEADFRKTGFDDGFFDVVVLDPPYMHGGATVKKSISKCYGNKKTEYSSHKAIIQLYMDGIDEAHRVLKPGGLLWVKCQDEIESGKQQWSHIEIMRFATRETAWRVQDLKMPEKPFIAKDLFVLVQNTIPARRQERQLHARKNHSYLWIFKKEGK